MRRNPRWRAVVFLLSVGLLGLPHLAAAQASVSDILFGQVSWLGDDDAVLFPHSSWGRVELTMSPDPRDFYYVNVVGDAGHGPAWLVQNWPVFPAPLFAEPRQAVDFNIRELGLAPGTPLAGFDARVTLDRAPLTVAPMGPLAPFGVASIEEALCGCGCGPDPVGEPGDPAGHKAEGAVEEAVKEHAIPPVQQTREGGGTCMAAAFARSLSWLNDEYDAGSKLSAQEMHDSLVKSGVVHSATTNDDSLIARKTRWADREFQGRIVTKIIDVENRIGPIPGVDEAPAGTDLFEWLLTELRTEDVELVYHGHMVTLVSAFKQGGKFMVKYRTDEDARDPNKGDTAVRTGQIDARRRGGYWFRHDPDIRPGSSSAVQYAVSESYVAVAPEPVSLVLLGTGLLGVGAAARRRRKRKPDGG